MIRLLWFLGSVAFLALGLWLGLGPLGDSGKLATGIAFAAALVLFTMATTPTERRD